MIRFKLNDKIRNMENSSEVGRGTTNNGSKSATTATVTTVAGASQHPPSGGTIREATTSRLQILASTVNSITTPATYNSNVSNNVINSNSSESLIVSPQAPKGTATLQQIVTGATATTVALSPTPTVLTTSTNLQYLNPPSNTHNLPVNAYFYKSMKLYRNTVVVDVIIFLVFFFLFCKYSVSHCDHNHNTAAFGDTGSKFAIGHTNS